jgi:two-component system response regulator CpxR
VRVLIAEDEQRLAEAIARGLRREGMAVDLAPDGTDALVKARVVRYDVLVLDRDLPGLHGDDVCRAVRGERPETGILMLTAAGTLEDLVEGLSLGADDYLPKPFNPRELVARLRAILRRASGGGAAAASQPIHLADVELHPESRSVTCGGKPVGLTGAEFDLLYTFLRSPGKIISREDLTQAALGRPMSPMDRSIDVHVSNLRRKLGPYDGDQERIKAIRGSGYVYLLPGEQA